MKRLLLVFLFFLAVDASAQIKDMWTSDTSAGTSWKKYTKTNYRKIFQFEVSNDTTAGTELLYIALSSTDTSGNRRFWLKYGESIFFESVQIDTLAIRASSGVIPYRVRYH